MGFPRYFHDVSMIFLWDYYWNSHGISLYDLSMGFLWDSYGISMVFL